MCEKISKGEIREIIVCGVQSGQAVISVSCSRHCGDGLSKFQHSHHEFSQISFNKRGGQCHLSHFWETKESLNQHVVNETSAKLFGLLSEPILRSSWKSNVYFAICGLLLLYGSSICVPWECHKTCLIYCSPGL